jgi:ribonuclease HII
MTAFPYAQPYSPRKGPVPYLFLAFHMPSGAVVVGHRSAHYPLPAQVPYPCPDTLSVNPQETIVPSGPTRPTQDAEQRLRLAGYLRVAGIDEVGRGPIAGPVVAAAVVLPELTGCDHADFPLIRDSKTLTAPQRERAAVLVRALTDAVGVGEATVGEIDSFGIVPATKLAMRRALDCLVDPPDHLLIDAVQLDWHRRPCEAVIRGDAQCLAIAAASVVAKVHRDAIMRDLDDLYPGYGFSGHKGYAARDHLDAIAALGPSPVHRMSFSPFRPTLFDSAFTGAPQINANGTLASRLSPSNPFKRGDA